MVEAAGRLFHPFRGGPDYAFIPLPGCGACYPFPDPSAGPSGRPDRPVYESLQGRPEVGPLPTPRRCHAVLPTAAGFADVSPVVTLPSRAEATSTDRTRVRKPSAVRTTCLAWRFGSRLAPAHRQADARPAASTDPPGQAARPGGEADVNDAAPSFEGLAHQQASAASRRC